MSKQIFPFCLIPRIASATRFLPAFFACVLAQSLATPLSHAYTDNFDRRNSRNLGLQWVESESSERSCDTTLSIVTNQARMVQCRGALAYWNESVQNDQYSKLKYAGSDVPPARQNDHAVGGPAVRIQSGATWDRASLYMAEYDRRFNLIRLWRYQNQSLNGPGTQLGSNVAATLVAGDWLEIRVEGSTIQVLKNSTVLITRTDATFASGNTGMATRNVAQSGTLAWTDWQGASLSNVPCNQDAEVHAPPDYFTYLPPAKGQALDAAHSIYCRNIKRLSDGVPPTGVPAPQFVHAEYATQNHFNAATTDADTRILVEAGPASGMWVIDLNGNVLKAYLDLQAAAEPMWDRANPFKFYFHPINGNQIKRRDVTTDVTETIATFPEYTSITGQGQSDLSPDGAKMVLLGTRPDGGREVFVYNLATTTKSPVLTLAANDSLDWLDVTNNFVVVGYGAYRGGAEATDLYTTSMGFQRRLANFIGHEDTGIDSNGDEILVISGSNAPSPSPCPGGSNCIIKYRLADGTFVALPSFDWSLASHIAVPSLPVSPSAWVYVSTYAPSDPDPSSAAWKPYTNEIVRFKLDGTAVERLAHHYSRPAGESYYWTPRSSINAAGTRVLFNSNFGLQYKVSASPRPTYTDVYMISVP